MALINYTEAVDVAGLFAGFGALLVSFALAWVFYRIYGKLAMWFDIMINKENKYSLLEEAQLDKIGQNHGFDLNKELVKRDIFMKERKNIRRQIEHEVYDSLFPKGKQEKP